MPGQIRVWHKRGMCRAKCQAGRIALLGGVTILVRRVEAP